MTNKEILKKQIVYRSCHRGTKEMDLLLGNFVKKYISTFNNEEINDLSKLLMVEDEIIHSWYYDNDSNATIEKTKVSELLKNFKL